MAGVGRSIDEGVTCEAIIAAGVPPDDADGVLELAYQVGASGNCLAPGLAEPLCDPTTLWRFYSAREKELDAAKAMYQDAIAWRKSNLLSVMERHGEGEQYSNEGSRYAGDACTWSWRRLPRATGEAATHRSPATVRHGTPYVMMKVFRADSSCLDGSYLPPRLVSQ